MSVRVGVSEVGCWAAGAVFGIGLHAAIAVVLLSPDIEVETGGPAGAFVVELAAVPVSRPDIPESVAPGPDQVEAAAMRASEPAPEAETVTPELESQVLPLPDMPPLPPLPPEPSEAVLLPAEPKTEAKPQTPLAPQVAAPTTSATQAISETFAERAAASQIAPPSKTASYSMPTWQSKLATALERSKRYPVKAQAHREEGVVQVHFVIDRQGRLVSSQVTKSSGYELLDREALSLLERAQPFPLPPAELKGSHVSLAVPVRFFLQ